MVGSGAALGGLVLAKQAPEAAAQTAASNPIIGAWTTNSTTTTGIITANLYGFMPGGVLTFAGSGFPQSAGVGAWADAGDGTVIFSVIYRRMDASGAYIGSTRTNARVTIAADGGSYSTTYDVERSDPQGNVTSTGQGTSQATRIVATPPTG